MTAAGGNINFIDTGKPQGELYYEMPLVYIHRTTYNKIKII